MPNYWLPNPSNSTRCGARYPIAGWADLSEISNLESEILQRLLYGFSRLVSVFEKLIYVSFRKQLRRQIPLAEVGQDGRRSACRCSPAAGHLDRGPGGGAGADAAHQAFELGQLTGRFHGVVVLHLHHVVDDVHVEHVGNEAGADALDRVLARLELLAGAALRDDGAVDRLDGDRSSRPACAT